MIFMNDGMVCQPHREQAFRRKMPHQFVLWQEVHSGMPSIISASQGKRISFITNSHQHPNSASIRSRTWRCWMWLGFGDITLNIDGLRIHRSAHTSTKSPLLISHRDPLRATSLAPQRLLRVKLGRCPRLASKMFAWGQYFTFKTLATKEVLSFNIRQTCFTRRASLNASISLSLSPPSSFRAQS